MKKLGSILVLSLFSFTFIFAQQDVLLKGINYQAVARDAEGQILSKKDIALQFSLISIDKESIFYAELHRVTTNNLGLFNLVIGGGESIQGDFAKVPWSTEDIWMETAIDENGGGDFKVVGTSRLLAVPYAFHANTASGLVQNAAQTNEEAGIADNPEKVGLSEACPCKGGYVQLELYYFGENDVTIEVYRNAAQTALIASYTSVKSGDLLTVNASGMPGGKFDVRTYIKVVNFSTMQESITEIYTDCPKPAWPGAMDDLEILGKTFGSFTVYAHTDAGYSNKCTTAMVNTDWHVGGNIIAPGDNQLGTRTNEALVFVTNDNVRLTITNDGQLVTENGIGLDLGGNFKVRGDNTVLEGKLFVEENAYLEKNLTVGDTFFSNKILASDLSSNRIQIKDNVPDGAFLATFENTNDGNGDGISIKINREETTDENNFITFYRKDSVAGRIEGYHHKWGDPLVIVEDVIKPMLKNTGDLFINTLGFKTPIELNLDFIDFKMGSFPTLASGSFPTLNAGSFPTLNDGKWPKICLKALCGGSWPSLSGGSAPSLSGGSLPSLNGGSLPDLDFESPIIFNNGVDEIIQPWKWFDPDWSEILQSPNDNNPVYKLFVEARENDWKTLVDMGITEVFIKVAEMELEANIKSEGVTYGSKGADYAEWLPRDNPLDKLAIGQIVGVQGGKISLNTDSADQILVISSKPIVLGNMPESGKENLYEKVAFMGQVPVWVKGKVEIGDYILASGDNDGVGVAVSPDDIRIEDIQRIVGKAWSISDNPLLNLINVAIGLNRNDITKVVIKQQQMLNTLETRLNNIEERLEIISTGLTGNK